MKFNRFTEQIPEPGENRSLILHSTLNSCLPYTKAPVYFIIDTGEILDGIYQDYEFYIGTTNSSYNIRRVYWWAYHLYPRTRGLVNLIK